MLLHFYSFRFAEIPTQGEGLRAFSQGRPCLLEVRTGHEKHAGTESAPANRVARRSTQGESEDREKTQTRGVAA